MIKFNYTKGFTLLEALVAISILMVAVVAPITIAQKGLSSATYSKNQMIASYLAQDAIEYIINKRDEKTVNREWNWLDNFTLCTGSNVCKIDTIKEIVDDAVSAYISSDFLKIDANDFYGYGGNELTNFIRKVNITVDPNGSNSNEALITVTVSWGGDNEVVVKTLIYNK